VIVAQSTVGNTRGTFIFCLAAVALPSPLNVGVSLFSPLQSLFLNLLCFVIPGSLSLLILKDHSARVRRFALIIIAALNIGYCLAQGILYQRGPSL